ncbi:MAG TPA: hypothetical protein VFH32_08515, partial [Rubrobacteraceae bacterium]|nr:hypothetical protein [Rubrobacteraceae bacterium]
MGSRAGPVLDLREPVRLDAWAITLAIGIVAGTVAPTLVPAIIAACIIFSVAALAWRSFVPGA